MGATRFDYFVQSFAAAGSRRGLLCSLAALPLGGPLAAFFAEERSAAKRRRQRKQQRRHDRAHDEKKKRKKCARAGQAPGKRRKRCCPGLVKGGSGVCSQPPSGCPPATCPPTTCGSLPDGCGGTLTCGCPANQICLHSGLCQPCDVTCPSGNPAVCGAALQAVMNLGGTVYVCPGRYRGGFTLGTAVTVVGAGEGADAASNTILDAAGAGRVLLINAGTGLVALERLHLTGGAGGVDHKGTTLHMTECTVSGNTAVNSVGGGIFVDSASTLELTRCTLRDNQALGMVGAGAGGGIDSFGTTTLTDCLVEANSADAAGGGLFVDGGTMTLAGSTRVRGNMANFGGGIYVDQFAVGLTIAETCRVAENTAATGNGGGIYNSAGGGTVTLAGANPSPIVVNNCHENCAGDSVAKCATTPVSC